MSAPLIGISTSELRTPDRVERDPEAEPPQRELALGLDYPVAVAAGGGLPVVLPPHLDLAGELIGRLDGLVLSGGHDLDPALYAQPPHPELGPIDPANDRWEMALLRAALERGIPVLGICRGMQLMNVTYGGSLYQDIPTELNLDPEAHRQKARRMLGALDVACHPVKRIGDAAQHRNAPAIGACHGPGAVIGSTPMYPWSRRPGRSSPPGCRASARRGSAPPARSWFRRRGG